MQIELCGQLEEFYKDAKCAWIKKYNPNDAHDKKQSPSIRHVDLSSLEVLKEGPSPTKRLKKNDGTSPTKISEFRAEIQELPPLPAEVSSVLSKWNIGDKQWISGKVYISWDHRILVKHGLEKKVYYSDGFEVSIYQSVKNLLAGLGFRQTVTHNKQAAHTSFMYHHYPGS